jgi:hypothetical protein
VLVVEKANTPRPNKNFGVDRTPPRPPDPMTTIEANQIMDDIRVTGIYPFVIPALIGLS